MDEPLLKNFSTTSLVSFSPASTEKKAKASPAVIRLLGGPNFTSRGQPVIIDMFDANNEESFYLESFQSLILAARNANKDFILAKVTTTDPQDGSKLYFSYYQGHNINKVAFRSEQELGLLHRMRARNPLDNMEIIGDIHYYTISPVGVDAALSHYQKALAKKQIQETIHSETIAPNKAGRYHQRSLSDTNFKLLKEATETSVSLNTFLQEGNNGADEIYEQPIVDILKEEMIIYDLRYYGTDEDYLTKGSTRDYFSRNAIHPNDAVLFNLNRPENHVIHNLPNFDFEPPNTIRPRTIRNLWGLFSYPHDSDAIICSGERQILLQTLIFLSFLAMVVSVIISPPTFFVSVIGFIGLLLIYQFVK